MQKRSRKPSILTPRNHRQEEHQTHRPLVTRKIVPQEVYKTTRHPATFGKSGAIKFVVNCKAGIRLSDASGGNWESFEGGDDRSPFEGDRLQIMTRLHIGHSAGVDR